MQDSAISEATLRDILNAQVKPEPKVSHAGKPNRAMRRRWAAESKKKQKEVYKLRKKLDAKREEIRNHPAHSGDHIDPSRRPGEEVSGEAVEV